MVGAKQHKVSLQNVGLTSDTMSMNRAGFVGVREDSYSAATFDGAKKGYYFGKGLHGMGYYRDKAGDRCLTLVFRLHNHLLRHLLRPRRLPELRLASASLALAMLP